jgi:type I restriction enzyme S subunit
MKMVELGELCEMSSGGTPLRSEARYYTDGTIPWVKISDIENADAGVINRTEEFITEDGLAAINGRSFDKGTVLFAMYGSVGKVAVAGMRLSTNQAILGIRPNLEKLHTEYLVHWLRSRQQEWQHQARGVALKNLSAGIVKQQKIPLPPLPTQRRIAAVLDKAQALVANDKRTLALYDQLAKSLFLEMFGDANPETSTWPLVELKDLVSPERNSMRSGPFGSDLLHSEFVDEGVAVLGIDNAVLNRFSWKGRRFITPDKFEKLKRYTIRPGDVLVTIMATIGRSAVVPNDIGPAINSKHLAAITLDHSKALPSFISFSIHSDDRIINQLFARSRGAIMNGLNLSLMKELKFRLPPIDVQLKFQEALELLESQKDQSEVSLRQTEGLFGSLLQRAFSGELAA